MKLNVFSVQCVLFGKIGTLYSSLHVLSFVNSYASRVNHEKNLYHQSIHRKIRAKACIYHMDVSTDKEYIRCVLLKDQT